jgi:hypothetical protein
MKAIIKIKDSIKGTSRTIACIINEHLSGATVENVLAEFTRQTGKAVEVEANQTIIVEVR